MSSIKIKYLKDEDGNTISPATSVDSVFDSSGTKLKSYVVNLIYPVRLNIF